MSHQLSSVDILPQVETVESTLARTAPLEPIAAQERIQLIDVLRGFALFGVLLANMAFLSGDFVVLTPERAAQLPTAGIDPFAKFLINFFVDNKANTLFSFLFGLGFAVQMMRAAERGKPVLPVYARRLFILLLIGVAHLLLLWYGDVLHIYAVMGFGLILFRKRSDKTLLILGVLLAVLPFVIFSLLPWIFAKGGGAEAAAAMEALRQGREARLAAFSSEDYFTVLRGHFGFVAGFYTSGFAAVWALYLFGRFLLGFYVGRKRLLHDAHLHLPLFRRLLTWGLILGIIGNSLFAIRNALYDHKMIDESSPWFAAAELPIYIGIPAMSLFYLSAITLLFQIPRWQQRFLVLAPVGRMALTNYLMQTLFHLFIFYSYGLGLGLLGHVGPSVCIVLSIVIFSFQILFSRWWLERFRFGPAEWLWRSLTYGTRQPMRLPHQQPATTQ